MRFQFRPAGCAACGFAALLGLAALRHPALAESSAASLLADDIERRLDGSFIFTTDGSGSYEVFQRLETRRGLSASDEVVCMMRSCYVAVAGVPAAALENRRSLEAIRHRFRAARDAYGAVLGASGEDLARTIEAWRDAGKRLQACLSGDEGC